MVQVYRYDEDFIFEKPILIEDVNEGDEFLLPERCTEIQPPSFFKAKFDINKQEWFESATQEYIDSLTPLTPVPTDLDKVKQHLGELTFQLMMGGFI